MKSTYKIGTPELPVSEFARVWRLLADHYKNRAPIWCYDIMNEPVGFTNGATAWPVMAQAAVNEIRVVDTNTPIMTGKHSNSIAYVLSLDRLVLTPQ